jgi:hypothetical protein
LSIFFKLDSEGEESMDEIFLSLQEDFKIASKKENSINSDHLKPAQEDNCVRFNEIKMETASFSKTSAMQDEMESDYINTFEECLKAINYIIDKIEDSVSLFEIVKNEKTERLEEKKATPEWKYSSLDPFDQFINQSIKKKIQTSNKLTNNTQNNEKIEMKQMSFVNKSEPIKIVTNSIEKKITHQIQEGFPCDIDVIPYLDDSIESKLFQSVEKIYIRQIKKYFDDDSIFKFQTKINELNIENVQYSLKIFIKNNQIDFSKFPDNYSIEFRWLLILEYLFSSINLLFNFGWDGMQIYDIFIEKYGSFIEGMIILIFKKILLL